MEKKQPQKHTLELKSQIAMAAISGQMTVQEIMKKCGVSKTAISTWKHDLEQKATSLPGGKVDSPVIDSREQQKRIDNLHRKIGELEMELDFTRRPSVALGIEMPANVRILHGHAYLYAIINVYSRMIVSWGLNTTLEASNAICMQDRVIDKYGVPQIINSDQSSQHTCRDWIETLKFKHIKINMDGR